MLVPHKSELVISWCKTACFGIATLYAFHVLRPSLFSSARLMISPTIYCRSGYIFHVSLKKDLAKSDGAMMDGKSIELERNHPWPIFFKLLRCSTMVFKYVNVVSTSCHSAFSYIGLSSF